MGNEDYLALGKDFEAEDRDGKKIMSAPCEQVAQYRDEVLRILWALGHPEAWVSDLVTLVDFSDEGDPSVVNGGEKFEKTLFEASNILGFTLTPEMLIVDAAKQLAANDKTL